MEGHWGQSEAWKRKQRFLALLAGWQSGKTDFLVEWVFRQAGRAGPGDALVLAPTHRLLEIAPEPRIVERFQEALGKEDAQYKVGDHLLIISAAGLKRLGWTGKKGSLKIWFRHTQDVKAVEAATALWLAADECGQMPDEIWEAINGRTSATGGDVLLISRPYFDNWFREFCETQPDNVVGFASWDNPGWLAHLGPEERDAEIERLRNSMPLWRFEMKYGGVFTRPAGAIYDCYVDKLWNDPEEPGHLETSFEVPPDWERVYGVDFGSVHTAVRCYAKDPVLKTESGMPVWHNYRTYFPNQSRHATEHVRILKNAEPFGTPWPPLAFGGNQGNESDQRDLWGLAGLPVVKPLIGAVEAGIDAVYACIKTRQIRYFDTLKEARSQKRRYSWKVNDDGDPIPGEIEDKKVWHLEDAERYAAPYFGLPECGQASRFSTEKKFRPTETNDHPDGWQETQHGKRNEGN